MASLSRFCLTFLLLAVALHSKIVCAAGGVHYTAAVFEHRPVMEFAADVAQAQKAIRQNLADYEQMAIKAREQGANIIVFPEDGIDGLLVSNISLYAEPVPSLEDIVETRIVPCADHAEQSNLVLWTLSCMAQKHGMAVVANMADHNVSTGDFYNTDVAFDTDGRLLMKYHKQHLFFEKFTPGSPTPTHLPVFKTSFGVTFGMCTCYDILFPDPCHQVVVSRGVTDLAFPTAWMNAGPLLFSTAIQQSFSAVMNVNVLAANLHLPAYKFTGSGIYSAGGRPEQMYISDVDGPGRLLVSPMISGPAHPAMPAQYQKPPTPSNQPMPETLADLPYDFKLVHPGESSAKSCHFDFCCSLDYDFKSADGEVFALGAYSGLKAGQPVKFHTQACSIVKCKGSTLSTCSESAATGNVTSQFDRFTLSAPFSASVTKTRMYPVVMTSGGGLVDFTESLEIANDQSDGNTWSMSLVKPHRVTVAGLFAHPSE